MVGDNSEWGFLTDNSPQRPIILPREATARTWASWSLKSNSLLWQAVALHSNLEPDSLESNPVVDMLNFNFGPKVDNQQFVPRLQAAVLHVEQGLLPTVKTAEDPCCSTVQLSAYAHWATSLKLELPPQFPVKPYVAIREPTSMPFAHQTQLLSLLTEASNLWKTVDQGGNYDPSDPTTAPTNAQVEAWLERKGISKKARQVMATILRADDMPSGRRAFKKG